MRGSIELETSFMEIEQSSFNGSKNEGCKRSNQCYSNFSVNYQTSEVIRPNSSFWKAFLFYSKECTMSGLLTLL